MKFLVAGGESPLNLIDDLKVRIAFNRFSGDVVVKTIFPNVNTNSDGEYEAVADFGGAGGGNVISSVTIESKKLDYVVYGIIALMAVFVIWIFTRK